MHITLSAIGRLKSSPLRELYEEYKKRLDWKLQLFEHESASSREREGELLMKPLPSASFLIALDERGDAISSQGFADLLQKVQLHHQASVSIVIGGADGLAPEIREKANRVLSFGAMTWPHLMARVMLMEQLYRAQQILKGHPYHRA